MTTNPVASSTKQVYLPLIFFFNRNPGLALPLIALQYHEVRIDIDLTSEFDTYVTGLKVWGNYMYLDTEERRRFAQKGHEYLIEQVQHTGTDSLTESGTKQVRLSYNHPVKELVWCVTESTAPTCGTWYGEPWPCPLTSGLARSLTSLLPKPVRQCSRMRCRFSEDTVVHSTAKLVLNGQDRFRTMVSTSTGPTIPTTLVPHARYFSYSSQARRTPTNWYLQLLENRQRAI